MKSIGKGIIENLKFRLKRIVKDHNRRRTIHYKNLNFNLFKPFSPQPIMKINNQLRPKELLQRTKSRVSKLFDARTQARLGNNKILVNTGELSPILS